MYTPYKINEFEESDGKTIIKYTKPEMDEYLKSMEVSGEIDGIDWSQFKLAEGVSIAEENDIETFSNDCQVVESRGEIADVLSKSISLNVGDYLTIGLTASDFKVKYNYSIDNEAHRVKNAYAIVTGNIASALTLGTSLGTDKPIDQDDAEIELGELYANPIVSVKLSVVCSVDGSFLLKATFKQTGGVQIINNMCRPINKFSVADFYAAMSVSGSVGIKTSVSLKVLTEELLSAYYAPKGLIKHALIFPECASPSNGFLLHFPIYSRLSNILV